MDPFHVRKRLSLFRNFYFLTNEGIYLKSSAWLSTLWIVMVLLGMLSKQKMQYPHLFSDPIFPQIKFWTQVTLNSVKLCWTPPSENNEKDNSSYGSFRVGVKRLQNLDSFVAYEKEEFVKDFAKGNYSRFTWLKQKWLF